MSYNSYALKFINGLEDIPLYKKMEYVKDSLILFDKIDGRYVSVEINGDYEEEEVIEFYKMILIKHRVNNTKNLKKLNRNFGVEIDLRSNNKNIYLHHDPFKQGEKFENWIKKFKHKLIVLNVKEEGLEEKILNILKTSTQ